MFGETAANSGFRSAFFCLRPLAQLRGAILGATAVSASLTPRYVNASSKPAQQNHAGSKARTLRMDPRRLMSKLLHVLNVRPRIDSGMAVRAALTAQFQHT